MLRHKLSKLVCGVALCASIGSTACTGAAPSGRLYVRVGPPAPVIERRVVSPGPGYIWVPGYYSWNGGSYVWVSGRWDRPPRGGGRWVNGSWHHDRGGWFFVEGHWR